MVVAMSAAVGASGQHGHEREASALQEKVELKASAGPSASPRVLTAVGQSGSTWCADDRCAFPTAQPTTLPPSGMQSREMAASGECCQRFFKCLGSRNVYYQNHLSPTKHLLANASCPTCVEKSMCSTVMVFAEAYCDSLQLGSTFDCSLVLCMPTTTTTTTTTTTESSGVGIWGWLLPALLVCCCCALVATAAAAAWFFLIPKRRAKRGGHPPANGDHLPAHASGEHHFQAHVPQSAQFAMAVPAPSPRFPTAASASDYDLLTITPEGYDVRPSAPGIPLGPPPPPLAPLPQLHHTSPPQSLVPPKPLVTQGFAQPQPQPMPTASWHLPPAQAPLPMRLVEPIAQPLRLPQVQPVAHPLPMPQAEPIAYSRPVPLVEPIAVQSQPMPQAEPAYDLITLTPQGYEVRPLNNPAGVPLLSR